MDASRREKLLKLALRSLPIAPGPELFDLYRDFTQTRPELESKVDKAVESIKQASTLVAELEATLGERTKKLESLKAELDRVSKLAAVEEERAAPLLKELEGLMAKGRSRERIAAFVINIVAGILVFLAGAYFGPRLFPSPAEGKGNPAAQLVPAAQEQEPKGTAQDPSPRTEDAGPKGNGE